MSNGELLPVVRGPGKRLLNMLQERYPTYHPLMAIADLANSEAVKIDPRLALECHKTILQYVEPKLQSIEVKADITETRRVMVSLFEGEITDVEELKALPPVVGGTPDADLIAVAELEMASIG